MVKLDRYVRSCNTLNDLSNNVEPWYIQNPRHIQNTVKNLRWNVLQKYLPSALLIPSSKKNQLWKNFFSQKKRFTNFRNRKCTFQEKELCSISGNGNPTKLRILKEKTYENKNENRPLWKNVLYFGKWNFLVPGLKRFYI